MLAINCKLGKQLRNKASKEIWEVEEVDGFNTFVNQWSGDTSDTLDEDLFHDLDYCN